jgi:EmrB/QacA subfamily drug resistance transporter
VDSELIHRRRWAILSVMVLCLLVVILDNTILNVALKTIQADLSASQSEMQWAIDSYALVFAGLLITGGVLGDRLGRKRMLLFGMVAFGLTSALCSFAGSPTTLVLFRALMGIGAAAVQPQTLSIIQNVFEPRERAKAIGIWAGASGMAIALGPITGGLLLKYFWWGSIFLVNVPIVIVAVVGIVLLVPDSKDPRPNRLDPAGVLLSIVALVVLVYGVIQGGNTNDWLRWDTAGAIVLGVALLALFVWLQKRSTHPTIDVTLFKNRHFSSGAVAIATTFFALMGSTFYLAYYLQAVRGYTALAAGLALIAVAGAVMIAAPLSARLSQRFGPRLVTGTGMTIFGLTLISYTFASQTMPIWVVEVQMFATGAGMGLTMSPATNAIMSAVPREKAGAGSAVNNTVRQVAGALGVAILGSILAVAFRGHLGADTATSVAAQLDQPAAVVAQLPDRAKVGPHVAADTTQSIGNAFEFVASAGDALQARGSLAGSRLAPQQLAEAKAKDQALLATFIDDAKASFMSAMHVASGFAGLATLLGAGVAFMFLPTRREDETSRQSAPGPTKPQSEPALAG